MFATRFFSVIITTFRSTKETSGLAWETALLSQEKQLVSGYMTTDQNKLKVAIVLLRFMILFIARLCNSAVQVEEPKFLCLWNQ